MMLIENEKKEYIKQASIRWRTSHPEALAKWSKKHPNYMKEWRSRNAEKQRQYMEIWSKKHPNYMKEWRSNVKGINAGSPQTRESRLIKVPIVKRFEGVDLAVVSESDKNIYREIDETMKKESASKRDEL